MKKLAILLFVVFNCNLYSQQTPLLKEYLVNNYYLSPAYTGLNGGVEFFILARKNMLGQVGAPTIYKISANGSVFENVGIGINIFNYKRGIFNTFHLETSYSYKLVFGSEHLVSFGLSGILSQNNINVSSIDELSDDPYFNFESNFSSINVNFGLGVLYIYKGFRLGVSSPLLLKNKVKSNSNEVYELQSMFRAHTGYLIKYNSLVFSPLFLINYQANNLYWEGSILCQYRKLFWGGLSAGKNKSAGITIGVSLHDNVILNYTYDFNLGQNTEAYYGSHELNIGILISKNKTQRPPFSIFKEYREQPYYNFLEE